MMIALAGSILKVRDNRNATAPTGPRPGSTPTSVPTSVPRKQNKRFVGVSATENPRPILLRRSTLESQNSAGQRNPEKPGKNGVGDQRGCERDTDYLAPALRLDGAQQNSHQQKRCRQVTQRLDHKRESDHGRQGSADSEPAPGI